MPVVARGEIARLFLDRGYRVTAFDASHELARLAEEHTGLQVQVRSFIDVKEQACYDGIWACASLLHVEKAELPAALACLWNALKPGGVFYLSFKMAPENAFKMGVTLLTLKSSSCVHGLLPCPRWTPWLAGSQ